MIIIKEDELFKDHSQMGGLVKLVEDAIEHKKAIHEVEGSLFQGLLQLGLTLLTAFVAGHGDGPSLATRRMRNWWPDVERQERSRT